jgi:hypothetical protein
VYCLESVDNPLADLERAAVKAGGTGVYRFDGSILPGGLGVIDFPAADGGILRLIPYYAWGNRGKSAMRVWLKTPFDKKNAFVHD